MIPPGKENTINFDKITLGAIFPTGFISYPLKNYYTTTTPQKVYGQMNFVMAPSDHGTINIWNERDTFISALKNIHWIESVKIIDDLYSSMKCEIKLPISTFELTISNNKVDQLFGLLPLVKGKFDTIQGFVEYRMLISDRTIDYSDTITSTRVVRSPTNTKEASSSSASASISSASNSVNRLESSFTNLPPVGTSKMSLKLSICNAYGCSNPPVNFKFDIFQAPTELEYVNGKVDSGSVLLTFTIPTLNKNDNILPLGTVLYRNERSNW